jgi:hypothetical protein
MEGLKIWHCQDIPAMNLDDSQPAPSSSRSLSAPHKKCHIYNQRQINWALQNGDK